MNLIERAIEEIEKRGWSQGNVRDRFTGEVCLVGGLGCALEEILPALVGDRGVSTGEVWAALPVSVRAALEAEAGVRGFEPGGGYPASVNLNDSSASNQEDVLDFMRHAAKRLSNDSDSPHG